MRFVVKILLLLLSVQSFACDACGCVASGGGGGYSAIFDDNYLGFRHLYQQYRSKDGVYKNSPFIKDVFHTVQLWGKVRLTNRLEVLPNVPMQFLSSDRTSGKISTQGMGDMSLNFRYLAFVRAYNDFEHSLYGGAGVKLPTGKFDAKNNGSVNPGFQLGTGSWDYSFLADYSMKYKSWGLFQSFSYVVKTANRNQYRFGNQLNYQVTAYRVFGEETKLIPNVGVVYENYEQHQEFGEGLRDTEGRVWLAKLALNAKVKKFGVGVEYYAPVSQDMLGGRVIAEHRFGLYLNYSL